MIGAGSFVCAASEAWALRGLGCTGFAGRSIVSFLIGEGEGIGGLIDSLIYSLTTSDCLVSCNCGLGGSYPEMIYGMLSFPTSFVALLLKLSSLSLSISAFRLLRVTTVSRK